MPADDDVLDVEHRDRVLQSRAHAGVCVFEGRHDVGHVPHDEELSRRAAREELRDDPAVAAPDIEGRWRLLLACEPLQVRSGLRDIGTPKGGISQEKLLHIQHENMTRPRESRGTVPLMLGTHRARLLLIGLLVLSCIGLTLVGTLAALERFNGPSGLERARIDAFVHLRSGEDALLQNRLDVAERELVGAAFSFDEVLEVSPADRAAARARYITLDRLSQVARRAGRTPDFESRVERADAWAAEVMRRFPGDVAVALDRVTAANRLADLQTRKDAKGSRHGLVVAVLNVEHIVVCGHSGCGGIKAIVDGHAALRALPNLHQWLDDAAQPLRAELDRDLPGSSLVDRLVERNVLAQLRNLNTYPVVAERLQAGVIQLHGWVYDLPTGRVRVFDVNEDTFVHFDGQST